MNKEIVLRNMADLIAVRAKIGKSLRRAMKDGDKKEAEKIGKLICQTNKTMKFFGKRFFEVK